MTDDVNLQDVLNQAAAMNKEAARIKGGKSRKPNYKCGKITPAKGGRRVVQVNVLDDDGNEVGSFWIIYPPIPPEFVFDTEDEAFDYLDKQLPEPQHDGPRGFDGPR